MSKEAVGQMNTKIGSSEYWSKVNRNTILGGLMGAKTSYQDTLRELGGRAHTAIEEIYGDLSNLNSRIRFLDSSNRKALAKQVEGLYDVCRMTGVTVWHNSECVQGLNLSMMSPWTRNFRDERGIEKAIAIINKTRYSEREVVDLLKDASKWGIDSAAGRDPKKRVFLEAVAQGSISSRFLEDVAEEYQNQSSRQSYAGKCGQTVGSRSYMEHMETQVFGTVVSGFGNPDYERFLGNALQSVADQLERDLDNAIRENDYITDQTADSLKAVVSELDHCGVSTGSLNSKIEKLAWFVGGDPFKIRKLQQALNKLGYALTEDGVFGAKTLQAVNSLHEDLVAGAFPAVAWIDPLQSKRTGIEYHKISPTKKGVTTDYASLRDVSSRSRNIKGGKNRGITVFRADFDEDGLLHHINTVSGEQLGAGEYIPSSAIQRKIIDKFNHMKINESTYRWLKDFDVHAKKVRVGGGTILAVTGVVLEALELIEAIHIDTHDADGKIGKTTYSSLASLGGSWSLGAFAAKGGAMLGASIGTAIFPGVGTAIGGVAGSLILGIAGSYGGSKLGEFIIDITMVE